ncbi:M48 family metalloprotease [Dactylosporangium sp. NBC_01737]|uniref:M48 family metallopeptidase n=1 Tax=Dactylosporangium sp. NBC_01737 TaxID=2975959 RepID=UPI002E1069DC|nr:M48 family metalloprotease [Dactylosporangium sp. NBC_01737]
MGDKQVAFRDLPAACSGRVRFPGISSRAYEHPADRTALVAMRKLPGLDTAVKKLQSMLPERALRMEQLGSAVRTSERQFARIHAMLRDAADVLDLERVPELYIKQSPLVNASTIGMNEPFIVLETGLIDLLEPDELRFVIGHELGHAMSGHALYETIARYLIIVGSMATSVPLGGIGVHAIQAALLEWSRKAELSSDRAGLLVTQDRETCLRALMKLAGGKYAGEMDLDEFLLQADEYGQLSDVRDHVARFMVAHDRTHPMTVVRAGELNRWARGCDYAVLLSGIFPRRRHDGATSMAQELRDSAGHYTERIKGQAEPLLSNVKGVGSSVRRRITGNRRPELEQGAAARPALGPGPGAPQPEPSAATTPEPPAAPAWTKQPPAAPATTDQPPAAPAWTEQPPAAPVWTDQPPSAAWTDQPPSP